jgi:quinohemoprotein ethanol dehydrogenase
LKAAAGETLFHLGCNGCHGGGLQSTGAPAPDLRESALALDEGAVWKVVHDGALLARGMPQFQNFTREQVHQLYSYIRAGARDELKRQERGGKPAQGDAKVHGSGAS